MPAKHSSDMKFEIGHVLFIDIVGYSKLLINEQSEQIQKLKEIVRGTEQFRIAEAEGKLLRLPTGDGGALVFRNNPEAPVLCALEISKALKSHPELKVRMGIHSGPVNEITDLNEQANIAGAGINIAQRVMDCGDAGHILLSKRVADDLEQYPRWRPQLHDLGECEVKHGMRIGVVNLYTDEVGNPQLPKRFQALKKQRTHVRWAEVAVALLALAAIIAGLLFLLRRPMRSASAIGEKSIAVLPFENRSEDKANAYFADGIQDEILTLLSKIADLKVISRTSTQHYKSAPENLPEIARQLGVANILEGRVQKSGDAVRVNVQLIKAANDSHLWADTFDRKLTDIFSVESEVAKAIADQLRAKLTSHEEQEIAAKPTDSLEAYDAYLRGLAYALRPGYSERNTLAAVEHFTQAVKLDPKFAVAWAWLARVSALGYFNSAGGDVAGLRETAKDAVTKVTQLQPNLWEAFLAEGYFHYYCEQNYNAALASFEKARQSAPKASEPLEGLALVSRRKGDWQRSLEYFRQATESDPRNISLLAFNGDRYGETREYSLALKVYDQILEISPDNADALASKAVIYQSAANLSEAAMLLSRMRSDPSSEDFEVQITQRIYERRFADAIAMVKDAIARGDQRLAAKAPYGWMLADLKQFSGDTIGARIAWQQLRDEAESLRRTKGEQFASGALAAAYAVLGDQRKALAIVDQVPVDALNVGGLAYVRARIAVYAGNKDSAVEQLATSAHNPVPGGPPFAATYGDLKLNPVWDPLRGDPRFEKIVASLAPKDN
jgi:TolB-like protein/Tfp pilus assembly protein PilF